MVVPFAFLIFIFMLPPSWPVPVLYLVSFFTGLLMDVFSEDIAVGLHAASSLLAISLRSRILQLTGISNIRSQEDISLDKQSLLWYAFFLFPLIFAHHLAYYFLEAFSFSYFFYTFFKAILGSIYTFILLYIICITFYRR